jgi:hypothetical protein
VFTTLCRRPIMTESFATKALLGKPIKTKKILYMDQSQYKSFEEFVGIHFHNFNISQSCQKCKDLQKIAIYMLCTV